MQNAVDIRRGARGPRLAPSILCSDAAGESNPRPAIERTERSAMIADLELIRKVESVVASGSSGQRGELLRHLTDLFIVGSARYSDEEIALFDDVLTRLVAQIELSARALLSMRLSPISNAPPKLMRTLAFDDEIDVAAPALSQSERLDERALIENAKEKSQEHLFAISRRRSLSEPVTEVLVQRGDKQVVLSAAANRGARFSDIGFSMLVSRSDGDDELAERVGARPEIPPHLFLKLLATASRTVRAKLEAEHPRARDQVREIVADVTYRIREEALAPAPDDMAAPAAMEAPHRPDRGVDSKLAALAGAGRFPETAAALARACRLSPGFVEWAMRQDRPDTTLILARAAELSWPTVKSILALRARERDIAPSPVAASPITPNLASFERLKTETAKEIVQFYRRREQVARPTDMTN
jgi:uncharacterized protein (DUF2336 family)